MRTALIFAVLLAISWSIPLPAAAQSTEDDTSEGVLIFFRSPSAVEPALGTVSVEVEIIGEGFLEVLFMIDGEEEARLDQPPYRISVEFGNEFGPHRFEAAALGTGGIELARASRETPGLLVNDRVSLELRQLYVTVTSPAGSDVRLSEGDFEVRDEGIRESVVTFEGGDAALTVALLVDASESMRGGRLDAALAGAHAFLAGMNDLDEASVMLFSDLIRTQTPVSQEPGTLAEQLAGVEATGGTALNDALYVALGRLEERQGRRVVVLLSDGFDIHSILSIKDVLWSMRRSRSLIYWIELTGGHEDLGITSPWRNSESHAEEKAGLKGLVEESGGRVVRIEDVDGATAAFQEILSELREQYVLGYYPSFRLADGRWHRVRVKILKPGFKARTRGGYVD